MKILHIKAKGMLDQNEYDKIKKRAESGLRDGLLITDDVIQVEVLEINYAECFFVDGIEIRPEVSG